MCSYKNVRKQVNIFNKALNIFSNFIPNNFFFDDKGPPWMKKKKNEKKKSGYTKFLGTT